MGTRFEIVLQGTDEARLFAAAEAAIEAIEEVHATFTRFESTSLLAHLRRRSPTPVRPGRPDYLIFEAAEEIRRATDDVFDVCGGGTGTLQVKGGAVSVTTPFVELDFGAIAKGFGVDRAVERLRDAGVESAFVHGGTSSMYGLGAGPDGRGWRVALGTASDPVIDLQDQGMAVAACRTSVAGRDVHHLRAGRNGPAVTAARRAAVIGPSAGWADGWATAVALLGLRPAAMAGEWRTIVQDNGGEWDLLECRP